MIDGIPLEDFDDHEYDIDEFYEDDEDMEFLYKKVGCKAVHTTGIEGVITATSGGYSWLTHSGGQEAFIHNGELSVKSEACTPQELEAYLGHSNGLPSTKESTTVV